MEQESFDPSALESLGLHVAHMNRGKWLLIHRNTFDLILSEGDDEAELPIQAVKILIKKSSGRYSTRVWERDHDSGTLENTQQLVSLCRRTFLSRRPCAGQLVPAGGRFVSLPDGARRETHPVDRVVADGCLLLVEESGDSGVGNMCEVCQRVILKSCKEGGEGIKKEAAEEGDDEVIPSHFLAGEDEREDWDYYGGEEDGEDEEEDDDSDEDDDDDVDKEYKPPRRKRPRKRAGGGGSSTTGRTRRRVVQVEEEGDRVKDEDAKISDEVYPCNDCGKSYRYFGSLRRHARTQHGAELSEGEEDEGGGGGRRAGRPSAAGRSSRSKKHFCEWCSKGFEVKSLYLEHRTTHTGEKLYFCDECGKGFGFLSAYNYHVRMHLREKGLTVDKDSNALYSYCDVCGARFTSAIILRRHIKVKHEGLNTECVCHECGKTFKNKGRLLEHRNREHRTDDRYQCKVCRKRFGSRNMMERHRSVHAEPAFECPHCGKRVKKKESLDSHVRIHTGEAPYKCPLCSQCFRSAPALYLHTKSHHEKYFEQKYKDRHKTKGGVVATPSAEGEDGQMTESDTKASTSGPPQHPPSTAVPFGGFLIQQSQVSPPPPPLIHDSASASQGQESRRQT